MKCRRICRELLWLARFGEFGPSSQPHLDHLASCRGCRDEVGFDRAMVEQLRIALAARIENADPSSRAWEGILARAQTPEPAAAVRLWGWSTALIGRLRFATAMAGTGLALVLALNMDIVPVGIPATDAGASESEPTTLQQVPRMPPQRSALSLLAEQFGTDGAAKPVRPDPAGDLMPVGRIPPQGTGPSSDPATAAGTDAQLRIVFRAMQTPDPGAAELVAIEPEGDGPADVSSEPGLPS
jgi:hypothetical protein